jgi:coproporphyrinogen III oxidase
MRLERRLEHSLVHDRGTVFRPHWDGRIESIPMSLLPLVRKTYD